MHRHLTGTVADYLKDPNNGIPKNLIHNKAFLNEAVKYMAALKANAIEIVGQHGTAGHIEGHVLDTHMREGTLIHHMEKLKDFAKSWGENHGLSGSGAAQSLAENHDTVTQHAGAAAEHAPVLAENPPVDNHAPGNQAPVEKPANPPAKIPETNNNLGGETHPDLKQPNTFDKHPYLWWALSGTLILGPGAYLAKDKIRAAAKASKDYILDGDHPVNRLFDRINDWDDAREKRKEEKKRTEAEAAAQTDAKTQESENLFAEQHDDDDDTQQEEQRSKRQPKDPNEIRILGEQAKKYKIPAEAVNKYIGFMQKGRGPFNALVRKGLLTQEEAEDNKTLLRQAYRDNSASKLNKVIKVLKGTGSDIANNLLGEIRTVDTDLYDAALKLEEKK